MQASMSLFGHKIDSNISRILLVYQYKYCNLIGWPIACYQPLVCSGWRLSTKWRRLFSFSKFWRKIFIDANG